MKLNTERREILNKQVALVVILSLIITLLHYITGNYKLYYHDIYQRLYYIPAILAAFWFGLKGGLITSLITSLVYAPHLLLQLGLPLGAELNRFLEIIFYNIIIGITGFLSEQSRSLQNKYQKAAEELEESYWKLREQTDAILQMEEQLRRADRLSALGELSAGLAHEIRNPLASIKGTAEILKDYHGAGDKNQDFLDILIKEVNRLDKVVQDFLQFAKPQPMEIELCNVNEILRSVLLLIEQQAHQSKVELKTNLVKNMPSLKGDSEHLRQVFLNLILNAIQAMPNGGPLNIETTLQDKEINGDREVATPFIEVKISDTGIGIPAENRDKIFNPFFTTKKDGTGLGLAISYRIVENHKGSISVQSMIGKGTAFIVRLPV